MKRFYENEKYRISIIISTLIIIGYVLVIIVNYSNYSKIIRDDIKNITKLSSSNIYSNINNELVKPIFVSLTMANDTFLIQWLEEENTNSIEELQQYLKGIEQKYDYSSVFMVSEKSKNYYHYNGIHKQISPENDHDKWYYDFVESNKAYDLDVDIDEVNNSLTVFINCRITDSNNEFIGVVGVGLEMGEVQRILTTFEDAYGLEAFIIERDGTIQIHTNNMLIEEYNVNEDKIIKTFMPNIVDNLVSFETFRYKENGLDGYLITRYIEDMKWYLMVKKDTSVLRKSFDDQLAEEIIILTLVIIGVLIISNKLINNHERKLTQTAKIDSLTGLVNRRGFDEELVNLLKEHERFESPLAVFILDIDDFKKINDKLGHLFGDKVIERVSTYINKEIGELNILARWGGDEFAGFINGDENHAKNLLNEIIEKMNSDADFLEHNITISIGMTLARSIDTPDIIMARADKALYNSKKEGKNRLSII